ncbi:hypothetical protein ACW7N6_38055 [Streptomyces sp. UC1A3]
MRETTMRTREPHCTACGAWGEDTSLVHREGCAALDPAALDPREKGDPPTACPACGGAWGDSHQQANACLAPGAARTRNRFVVRELRIA